jgi:hypothetical protein
VAGGREYNEANELNAVISASLFFLLNFWQIDAKNIARDTTWAQNERAA